MREVIPDEIQERESLIVNPAKTCQPIGAMYAAFGIHGCLPHSHGSQGCCSYHRMHLTKHFREPMEASSSSFTEGSSVFGGRANLTTALKNIFEVYDPEVVAINTTCLSETIGDDIPSILREVEIPEGTEVFHANTPSFVGSHITGFSNMVQAMAGNFAEEKEEVGTAINVIPGFVNPGDIREIKRILRLMEIESIVFPDQSGVADTPMTGNYEMYPAGGTRVSELREAGNSRATVALGAFASSEGAFELERECNVKLYILKMPLGIKATDEFIMRLVKLTGREVPRELEEERGQLVDILADTHHHFHGSTAAIFGDPDVVIAMTEFALSMGMEPKYILTGTPGKAFKETVEEMLAEAETEAEVVAGGDMFQLQQWLKQDPVDVLIGNSYGKLIAKTEDIPLVRIGFPILDRSVHSYLPVVGYKGAMRVVEKISGVLLDRLDRENPEDLTEFVL